MSPGLAPPMPSHLPNRSEELLRLDPVPTLLRRVREELAADFPPGRPVRVSRAPGRLDVMGGIADYTGSLVCEYPLDRAAAVAVCDRDDRQVQVFSFNLLDDHKPFTLRVPLAALERAPLDELRREFDQPGRKWAAYLVGCIAILEDTRRLRLCEEERGLNIAVYSTVPLGAGVSSSAAVEVATIMAVADHFHRLRPPFPVPPPGWPAGIESPLVLAELCQMVENKVVGAPCGIMDQVTSCVGEPGKLLRMVCQPHELLPPLALPEGVRVVGINSGVKHDVAGPAYWRTRCAAFMGHRIILEKMREIGAAAGTRLRDDPMKGYLANLDPDDYKRLFRPYVPAVMKGQHFLDRFMGTMDRVTSVDERDFYYPVQHATDHHVLEARRVRKFAEALERAAAERRGTREHGRWLDRAGHLMYASHLSYTNDAMLGAPECDLLVQLVREREPAGLYGAKITGGGGGGTVAVLADVGARADAAIAQITDEYRRATGKTPELFDGTSPGAWHVGTAVVEAWSGLQ